MQGLHDDRCCVADSQDGTHDCAKINQQLGRATWSKINRCGQDLLSAIY